MRELNDALLAQRRDLGRAAAERRQLLVGVLAERWRGPVGGNAEQAAELAQRPLARLVEREDAVGVQIERLGQRERRADADLGVAEEAHPLVERARREQLVQVGEDARLLVPAGVLERDVLLAAEHAAQVGPEVRLDRRDGEGAAAGGGVDAVAGVAARDRAAPAGRHGAGGPLLPGVGGQPVQRPVGHRDIQHLPAAAALALKQRRQDADRRRQRSAAQVGDLQPRHDRPAAAARGDQRQRPGIAQVVQVVAGAAAQRASLPVAADRADDLDGPCFLSLAYFSVGCGP